MADKTKNKRDKKVSKGVSIGSKRERPSELLLIAMGKGMAHQAGKRRGVSVAAAGEL